MLRKEGVLGQPGAFTEGREQRAIQWELQPALVQQKLLCPGSSGLMMKGRGWGDILQYLSAVGGFEVCLFLHTTYLP